MKSTKQGYGKYLVEANGTNYQVKYNADGYYAGLWTVSQQDEKLVANGVTHWFVKDCNEKKRVLMRLIEDNTIGK